MSKPIHEHSLQYVLMRRFVGTAFKLFFRKVTVIGKENIPKDEPVLFAINHQCTLMDAFSIIYTLNGYQVFMARADIFKNPLVAKFLRFIKIAPIFRMRDGIKNLSNNDSSFNDAIGTLSAKQRLFIFPEGSHFGEKRLRSLKKGFARIAFQAEEKHDFKLGLKIIPVGIDYADYTKFGSRLLVQYGEPYTMDGYFDEYKENPQKAMSRLMGDLSDKMKPMMLHVNDTENYAGIKACCDLYVNYLKENASIKSHYEERINSQKLSDAVIALKDKEEDRFNALTQKAISIKEQLTQLNLRNWVLDKPKSNGFKLFLERLLQLTLLPIFLVGYIGNFIPFTAPVKLTKKVKDPLFLSSMRVAMASVFFRLYYIIALIVLLLVLNPIWLGPVILLSIALAGRLSLAYYRWFVKTSAKYRNNRLRKQKDETWVQTNALYNELIAEFNSLNL